MTEQQHREVISTALKNLMTDNDVPDSQIKALVILYHSFLGPVIEEFGIPTDQLAMRNTAAGNVVDEAWEPGQH